VSRVRPTAWVAHLMSLVVLAGLVLLVVHATLMNDGSVHGGTEISLVVSLVVGWILAWKRPRNPIGWLLVAIVGLSVSQVPAVLLAEAIRHSAPAAAAWLYSWGGDNSDWNWIPPTGLLFTQLPLRFPNGSLPSRRWRWFAWYTIGAIIVGSVLSATTPAKVAPGLANPIYVPLSPELSTILSLGVFGLLFLPSFAGSLASLFVRYRRSDAIERAQLRWVFWGLCIAIGLLVVFWLIPTNDSAGQVLESWALGAQALVPASILFAVLRYRLYDIDRIISRTVSYAIVTIVIAGVYIGIVLGISALLPKASSVGVAVATLAAAAVFLPLLRRVQRLVDRRFNRAAYNAQKVVEAFGQRLRSGADPYSAGHDLVSAVEQTLQPSAVGMWTRTVSR
jgi:hypothetical protein